RDASIEALPPQRCQRSAVRQLEAVPREKPREVGGREVVDVRRRQADLPHALERTACAEHVSRARDMLEHVVEYDDVETLVPGEGVRKEAVPDGQAALCRRACD